MDFVQQLQLWEKGELLQGKLMIVVGVLFLVAFIFILKSENTLLRGALIPVGLLLLVLIGYGGFILVNRPAHVKESIAFYEQSPIKGIATEIEKHTNDNKAGNTLVKVYPVLILVSALALIFIPSIYYKGMALGFIILFTSTYIIDSGFISRSETVLNFIQSY